KAQEAVTRAQTLASDLGNPQVEPLHLLSGLLTEQEGIVQPLLGKLGVNIAQLEQMVRSELDRYAKVSGGAAPGASADLMKVLNAASAQAEQMHDEYVSTEHLLLALADVEGK